MASFPSSICWGSVISMGVWVMGVVVSTVVVGCGLAGRMGVVDSMGIVVCIGGLIGTGGGNSLDVIAVMGAVCGDVMHGGGGKGIFCIGDGLVVCKKESHIKVNQI